MVVVVYGCEIFFNVGFLFLNGEVVEFESYIGEGFEVVVKFFGGVVEECIWIGKVDFVLFNNSKFGEVYVEK